MSTFSTFYIVNNVFLTDIGCYLHHVGEEIDELTHHLEMVFVSILYIIQKIFINGPKIRNHMQNLYLF